MKALNPATRAKLREHMPMLLSVLWVFLSLNYIYCDVLSNMEAATIQAFLDGNVAGFPITEGFLLFAGISLEIPFLMALLARVLPFKANRIANIAAASIMILYQAGSFFMGSSTLHYIFFSAVEIMGNIVILVLAAGWKKE